MKTLVYLQKLVLISIKKLIFISTRIYQIFKSSKVKILPVVFKNNKLDLNSVKYAHGLILAGGGDISKIKKLKIIKLEII